MILELKASHFRIGENVAHKVQRYKAFVASGPVPDVRAVHLRRWVLFFPATSSAVSNGGF